MNRPPWNEYFMLIAKLVASRSTCSSRPVGCVFVRDKQILASGYNGATPGIPHCIDRTMPADPLTPYCNRRALGGLNKDKGVLCLANHAEINAISMAAKQGINIAGSDCYITLNPCFTCLKALRVAGIDMIFYELIWDLNADDFATQAFNLGFKRVHQIKLSDSTIKQVLPLITAETSTRRKAATL